MIDVSTRLLYYKRKDIQEALVRYAQDKEIAVRYGSGFGKRPDVLHYPADVLELVKRGSTSFHCSEELWINPLQIGSNMKRHELNALRKGWDLILDIDCDVWEYSQYAGDLVVQALKYHDINAVSIKFSGNHGFHIGVPFEAFPESVHGERTADLFPEGPRKIAAYLSHMIKPHLAKKMLDHEGGDVTKVAARVEKDVNEVMKNGEFDPFTVLVIDTILISSRHLYRMPYSLNEKSGWASVPISTEHILTFDRATEGDPKNVVVNEHTFLDRSRVVAGEASKLLVQAFDFNLPQEEYEVKPTKKEFEAPSFALQEDFFPPCIKALLGPLDDGKKRAMFILTNFLRSVGWGYDKIEERLREWNDAQEDPLREVILQGHLNHHRKKKGVVLPPSCSNVAYYQDLRVCKPDNLCNKWGPKSIKNPVKYSMTRIKSLQWEEKHKEYKEKEKAFRKEQREKMKKAREMAAQAQAEHMAQDIVDEIKERKNG